MQEGQANPEYDFRANPIKEIKLQYTDAEYMDIVEKLEAMVDQ